MRTKIIIGVVCAVCILAFALYVGTRGESEVLRINPTHTITVGAAEVDVAIADSPPEQSQGLSGISYLAPDEGMLFVFERDALHSFWMKDMLFSIDILFVSMDGAVVHIAPSVSPDTYPQTFTSDTPVRYVLEVPAGFATEHGIGVGSKIDFSAQIHE